MNEEFLKNMVVVKLKDYVSSLQQYYYEPSAIVLFAQTKKRLF